LGEPFPKEGRGFFQRLAPTQRRHQKKVGMAEIQRGSAGGALTAGSDPISFCTKEGLSQREGYRRFTHAFWTHP